MSTKPHAELPAVAIACLAHMEQEEAMLSATLSSLRSVREALVQGDLQGLTSALDQQAHTARAAEELRVRRSHLRRDIATCCGTNPDAVTLQMLAGRVSGELGDRLANCRARLKQMATEADRLNRGNAALVRQSMDFLERLFAGLTGGESTPHTYSPIGQHRALACGAIIQGQG